jgi:hypothetical protein
LNIFWHMAIIVLIAASIYAFPDRKTDLAQFFKSETSVVAVIDSLKSPARQIRILAAERLGELKDALAIESLKSAYENEPYELIDDGDLGLKYHALKSIGKINGEDAKKYLMNLGDSLISPKSNIHGRQFYGSRLQELYGVFDGLSEYPDSATIEYLNSILNLADFDLMVREYAYESLIRIELKHNEYKNSIDTLEMLINLFNNSYSSTNSGNDSESIAIINRTVLKNFIINYGIQNTEFLNNYKSNRPPGDLFSNEISDIEKTIDQITREQKSEEDSQFYKR